MHAKNYDDYERLRHVESECINPPVHIGGMRSVLLLHARKKVKK